jgi:uncharacterized protein (TIGR03435 family)
MVPAIGFMSLPREARADGCDEAGDWKGADMPRLRGFNRHCVTGASGGILLLFVLSFPRGAAQAQSSPRLAFDVVSIKPAQVPNWLPQGLSQLSFRGRRFRADPVTAQRLIVEAFQLKEWQVVGGSNWVSADRFVMEATVNNDVPNAQFSKALPELLKSVLEDRFKLHVHKEQRQFRGYALVPAYNDRRLGPQIRASKVDCEAPQPAPGAATSSGTPPPPPQGRPNCMSISTASSILGAGMSMQGLADRLTGGNGAAAIADRPVVDRTELAGQFDFVLRWSPAPGLDGDRASREPTVPPQAPDWLREAVQAAPPPDGTSIFTALREQLGLKLVRRDERFDVLVIDHIERPSPN